MHSKNDSDFLKRTMVWLSEHLVWSHLLEQVGMTSLWAVKDFSGVCAWDLADFYGQCFALVLVGITWVM